MTITTTEAPELRAEEFRAWLASKKPREIVGERAQCTTCPVARYAHETLDVEDAWVGRALWWTVGPKENDPGHDLPSWVMDFTCQSDRGFKRWPHITAGRALRILDAVLAEQAVEGAAR